MQEELTPKVNESYQSLLHQEMHTRYLCYSCCRAPEPRKELAIDCWKLLCREVKMFVGQAAEGFNRT